MVCNFWVIPFLYFAGPFSCFLNRRFGDSKIPNLTNYICCFFVCLSFSGSVSEILKKPKDATTFAVFTDSLEDLEEMLLEGRKLNLEQNSPTLAQIY